ncbi:hypothetical protein JCM11491_000484 [Sporobolomyces phaffii]
MNAGMIMSSSSQHRRRISMPSTPPETPLDGYFDKQQVVLPPPHSTQIAIYPDSPPITPERQLAQTRNEGTVPKELEKRKDKETTILPTHGARKPSVAYAHHRRTSTATIIRLVAARQGVVLTPSKVITLFIIVFSATYLASFLPGPLASMFHHQTPRSSIVKNPSAPTYYAVPTVSGALNNKPLHRTMPIGETAQRRAWEDSFPHRIPPQQHVVPVKQDQGKLARSYHGDLYRTHPELLVSNTGSQPRRRPLRFGKAASGSQEASEHSPSDRRANPESSLDSEDTLDDPTHFRRQAGIPAERQAQINRMKKMAIAKQNVAKVGSSAPLDSSEVAAGAKEDRIHLEGPSESKKKLKHADAAKIGGERIETKEGATRKEGGKPRLGKKDRQVLDDESRTAGAQTVDEWAELEDPKK